MAREDERLSSNENESSLNFKDAQELTIEEAIRKESDLKAGITSEDGVLDKYIKKHREDILSHKFDATVKDFENLDTSTLDDFIQKQRQEISESDLDDIDIVPLDETTPIPLVAPTELVKEEASATIFKDDFSVNDESIALTYVEEKPEKSKKKVWWLIILLFLLAALMPFAYWMNQKKSSNSTSTTTTSTTKSSTSSSSENETAIMSEFNTIYDKFFADSEKTKLKNSEFDKLSELETILAKLKAAKSSHYDDYKAKYDALSKQIASIKAINEKYDSDVIVNGEYVASSLKEGQTLDNLSSETLNTGNASLDTLIQSIVSGQTATQGGATASVGGSTVSNAGVSTAEVATNSSSTSTVAQEQSSSAQVSQNTTPTISGYGLSSATNLQRSLSRVPYNYNLIADSTNPAWSFNPGILERIIQVSHERGYFSGNDYILEPVNIVNGNGYYNMFKTDGTYLFSINCKTGYFVGNAAGHADSLDY